jgi:hypothetical protein
LEQKTGDGSLSNFVRQDAQLSLGALKVFQRADRNLLGGYSFTRAPTRQPHLMIAGVDVSINLDLMLERERNGRRERGGALLRLTKADEEETDGAAGKRRDMGLYAATLAQMQVAATLPDGCMAHHDLCMSIDVQAGEVHLAGRNFATRAARLAAECRFIAAIWDTA